MHLVALLALLEYSLISLKHLIHLSLQEINLEIMIYVSSHALSKFSLWSISETTLVLLLERQRPSQFSFLKVVEILKFFTLLSGRDYPPEKSQAVFTKLKGVFTKEASVSASTKTSSIIFKTLVFSQVVLICLFSWAISCFSLLFATFLLDSLHFKMENQLPVLKDTNGMPIKGLQAYLDF